ncbi:MAG TPA: N-methyl-L-tryptophan oxidase [Candidatus Baltobacteraceae bacterium]|jgi:sarcosine oxidase|nr:N-methyl-L-tryptophan oxidase [Candidatus Baltobacteraceae bacterium]
MGASSLAACARRGASTIGFDRYERGHALGASSGKTRLIRQAYFENPAYVPLLLRAYELWAQLERETQQRLLYDTGLLMVGRPESGLIRGSLQSSDEFALPVELWNAPHLRYKFPQLRVLDTEVGVYERAGGALIPERAVNAYLILAQQSGAQMRFEARLMHWHADGAGVTLHFEDGSRIRARRLILALGPWMDAALEALGIPLVVQRNVQAWFAPGARGYSAGDFPSFLLERDGYPAILYGFPDLGDGVKAAFHKLGTPGPPDAVDRAIDLERDVEPVRAALNAWMPDAAKTFLDAKVCMYALTPDEHFVIDAHPEHRNVVILGGFSGHGFKFASVAGEIAAQLALDGGTENSIGFLSIRRFR